MFSMSFMSLYSNTKWKWHQPCLYTVRENEACPIRACVGCMLFYNRVQRHGWCHKNLTTTFMTLYCDRYMNDAIWTGEIPENTWLCLMFSLDIFLVEMTSFMYLSQQRDTQAISYLLWYIYIYTANCKNYGTKHINISTYQDHCISILFSLQWPVKICCVFWYIHWLV